MSYISYVVDRATNTTSDLPDGNTISLSSPSDVRLDIEAEDIEALERRGDDLVVRHRDGAEIVIEDFYVGGESELTNRLIVDGDIIAEQDITSGLLASGNPGLAAAGLALAGGGGGGGGGGSGSGSGSGSGTAADALATIEAYNNGDGTTPAAPTAATYTNAGITDVTSDNLDVVNAKVLAAATGGADTVSEVQALVTAAADALAKIEAYNNGNGTSPAALTVADYAAAGITGVTTDNLAAVNAQVLAAATGGADTVSEVQALVTAADAALAKIEAYNNGNGTSPAALTVADYAAAGITGVTTDNLGVVNAKVLAAATGGADTVSEVQALVTAAADALAKIEAYNNGDGTSPAALAVADYAAAGITGVTTDNLAAVNAQVLAAATGGADTVSEVQALVTAADAALATIEAYNNGNGTSPAALTVAEYAAAGITGVTTDNLAAVNAQVLAAATGGADTVSEVQALVTAADAALATIEAYNNGNGTSPAALTVQDYVDAGITGVTAGNLAAVNAQVLAAATGGADTVSEVQALVTAADAALATIEAYNNGNGTSPAALAVQDYVDAGITGVTADNLDVVNAKVLAAATGGADTSLEVQALVDAPLATIDLSGEAGFGGQLINPVEVLINGVERTFYFWDRSGNGVAGSGDLVNHNVLDTLFNGGADTTDAIDDRSYTMADGTILRLPTNGTEVGREVYRYEIVASPTENQTVLDDFAAINDAFNGVSSGTLKSGTPDGWEASNYWTATSTGAGYHVAHGLHVGTSNASLDGNVAWLALEVV
jgi:outer membrane translocation and assembly module TamA